MSLAVKICGLQDENGLRAAIDGGAAFIGFNFVPSSRRFIEPRTAAALLAPYRARRESDPTFPKIVGLFVNPSDEEIAAALSCLALDFLQLHGAETPARVSAIKNKTGLPILKAIPVATADDLAAAFAYEAAADMVLFDTKTTDGAMGGTGQSFDWTLLKGRRFELPWMLAGGIEIGNVAEAVSASGAKTVDLSSGVETDKQKDPEKIRAFLSFARTL